MEPLDDNFEPLGDLFIAQDGSFRASAFRFGIPEAPMGHQEANFGLQDA